MNKNKTVKNDKISAQAMRQFAENRRIANKAVQIAIEENRKIGISGKDQSVADIDCIIKTFS